MQALVENLERTCRGQESRLRATLANHIGLGFFATSRAWEGADHQQSFSDLSVMSLCLHSLTIGHRGLIPGA